MVKSGGYISVSNDQKNSYFKESFKGEVQDQETTFPKVLGAKHPFNFEDLEKVYKKYGVLAGAINKIASSVVTDFSIKLKNPNAQEIIDDFLHNTNFHTKTNVWVREGVLKGNGFMEIDLDDEKIRVMNANHMYVKRDKKGNIKEYNQWTKNFKSFSRDSKDLIPFKPNEIAHLPINKIPNDPYGIGMVWSNERVIENLIGNEQDLQKLISRKAGQPYHIKVGQPGKLTSQSIVDNINQKLQYLSTRTEWVTDGDIEIKTIGFEGLGKNITEAQMYFYRMLLAGLEVPEVLMGSGQLNEGIAKVQLKAYQRKVKSIQNQVADIIEEQIINPLLEKNGLKDTPMFIWDLPDEEDINLKLTQYQTLINSNISPELKASLEIKIAELLEDDKLLSILKSPQQAQKDGEEEERRKEEEEIPQPETPRVKPNANFQPKQTPEVINPEIPDNFKDIKVPFTKEEELSEFIRKNGNKYCVISHKTGKEMGCYPTKAEAEKRLAQIKRFSKNEATVKEWIDLKEIDGFNYNDYLVKIIQVLSADEFLDLLARNALDIQDGLLPKSEIDKLREVLKTGFKENQTILEIENNIKNNVKLTDRKTPISIIPAASRPNMIARTETVRLASKGIINLYEENGIKRVSWVASISERTCPICESQNGKIFTIQEVKANEPIPAHTSCRCTWVSI